MRGGVAVWKRGSGGRGVKAAVAYAVQGACDASTAHELDPDAVIAAAKYAGQTVSRHTVTNGIITRDELVDRMTVLLGGRAAEWVTFHHTSTGAADDLVKVTDIARDMTMRFGMDPGLGPVSYEGPPSLFMPGAPGMGGAQEKRYSEATAREIDEAVHALVTACFQRTVDILTVRSALLERGAQMLLERETLDEEALKLLRAEVPPANAVKPALT